MFSELLAVLATMSRGAPLSSVLLRCFSRSKNCSMIRLTVLLSRGMGKAGTKKQLLRQGSMGRKSKAQRKKEEEESEDDENDE